MRKVHIHTELDVTPHMPCCEHLVITRGSSAGITFDLESKVYSMDNIEQAYFIFKYKDNTTYYSMINYYEACGKNDLVIEGVEYFNKIAINTINTSGYVYKKVTPEIGTSAYGYYIISSKTDVEDWQFDSHFVYEAGYKYSYINFYLNSDETKQLALTNEDNMLNFEIAVKLDTNNLPTMNGEDSVIVEPQSSIKVVDSMYANLDI